MSDALPADAPSAADVAAAAQRLAGRVKRTPLHCSQQVDERVGARVLFKCENLQRVGAFKFRGATNALLRLSPEQRARGVVSWSSGNHAQALARASREQGVAATIVMPQDAPAIKLAATRGYGAEVVLYDRQTAVREEIGRQLAAERGLTIVPPYDHPDVIAGQGTVAWELAEQAGHLDLLLVPCGGGGLLSGCALATKARLPGCRVVGVEPAAADDATRSFKSGELTKVHEPDTICDGARTPSLGRYTFPLVRRNVDDMVTVDDDAVRAALRFLLERLKLVIEPTGALAYAALHSGAVQAKGQRVGVVISGGNVDVAALGELLGG
ncbi:MAG TPA: threo-3-hydroxy-L-aspartate ammonia-lyase [Planctomycetes bacterium]|nr:threo-3-hydroxy-L-aspartate ammonia-lyase [Planctomycetota bacterium]